MVHDASVSEPSGTECTRLVEFINSSDAGFTTVTGCRDAARKLQWAFDMHDTLRGEQRALTAVVYPALLTEDCGIGTMPKLTMILSIGYPDFNYNKEHISNTS
ncbi:hypothetical protein CEP51_000217 [Fusarium floridanum]|uniref:Uncharacterized protein n=1 Tax=Fusarium floridanum TaxID=1325733 RepID=A0A428SP03_9HYPO|nr:hypothetical protein CEP51_000217 [Fusarium floridanum]